MFVIILEQAVESYIHYPLKCDIWLTKAISVVSAAFNKQGLNCRNPLFCKTELIKHQCLINHFEK